MYLKWAKSKVGQTKQSIKSSGHFLKEALFYIAPPEFWLGFLVGLAPIRLYFSY